jgi:hypothetical protein
VTSNIDPTKPTAGTAFTADVRANFATAKAEIEALQQGIALLVTTVQDLGNVTTPSVAVDLTTQRVYAFVAAAPTLALVVSTTTPPGMFITGLIAITQDATGGRTMTFPSTFRWQGGYAPSLSVVPGATDILQVSTWDGGLHWFAAIAMQAPPPT